MPGFVLCSLHIQCSHSEWTMFMQVHLKDILIVFYHSSNSSLIKLCCIITVVHNTISCCRDDNQVNQVGLLQLNVTQMQKYEWKLMEVMRQSKEPRTLVYKSGLLLLLLILFREHPQKMFNRFNCNGLMTNDQEVWSSWCCSAEHS